LHESEAARNCYVYLESLLNSATGTVIPLETIEFKWAGYLLPNAVIAPGSVRYFDAFWVRQTSPGVAQFNVFSESTRFTPGPLAPGQYKLTFAVMSENFPTARGIFTLLLDGSLDGITFAKGPTSKQSRSTS
jgi:hypothetical protein